MGAVIVEAVKDDVPMLDVLRLPKVAVLTKDIL
jgi:hypothetical protein